MTALALIEPQAHASAGAPLREVLTARLGQEEYALDILAVRPRLEQRVGVLVTGESGTGKELVARALQRDQGIKDPTPEQIRAFPSVLMYLGMAVSSTAEGSEP